MALPTTLIPSGIYHSQAEGDVVAGAGFGEVAGVGPNQLCRFLLPYPEAITDPPGFQDQVYVIFKTNDGNISDATLDAVQFETDPTTGLQVIRLLLDVDALPANIQANFEAHQSAGR